MALTLGELLLQAGLKIVRQEKAVKILRAKVEILESKVESLEEKLQQQQPESK